MREILIEDCDSNIDLLDLYSYFLPDFNGLQTLNLRLALAGDWGPGWLKLSSSDVGVQWRCTRYPELHLPSE